ncbi:hypothetical protein RRG08_009271 [Elysia crispata]|uniref:Uncharacterized protein n=1 Tax=Elysia crispata TaxID=231223 RepID=A0AAE0ZQ32_9GAST|nr:hypothetical protein RRG08_009271 [Elysia crispata]
MESALKLSLVALTLVGVSASLYRERRFLLDVTERAKDLVSTRDNSTLFSWDIGKGKFPVENKDAVSDALTDVSYAASEIAKYNSLLLGASNLFRAYVLFNTDDKNLDKWTAAADTVTGLYDAAETVHEISKHYVLEISRAVQNDTDHQSHLIDRALRTARIAVYRVETLIQDATAALMELRDVHEGNETDIVYGFLLQLLNLSNDIHNLKGSFKTFIEAVDIESVD